MIVAQFYPSIHFLAESPPWLLYLALILTTLIRATSDALVYTSVNIMINLSAGRNVGVVNGINYSVGGLTSAMGPTLGGNLYAWSVDHIRVFPLNYYFVFELMFLVAVVTVILLWMGKKYFGSLQLGDDVKKEETLPITITEEEK
jgi:MFS family permease